VTISPAIAGLVELLPVNGPEWAYESLIKLTKHLLETNESTYNLKKVAPEIGLGDDVRRLGCVLRSLSLRSKKSGSGNGKGNIRLTRPLLNLLHVHGVVYKKKGGGFGLNARITGHFKTDAQTSAVYPFSTTSKNRTQTTNTVDVNLFYLPSFSIRPYSKAEIAEWESRWLHKFGKSFSASLTVAQTILDNTIPEDHGATSIRRTPDMCWVFNNGVDAHGYSHLNVHFLKSSLPNSGILPQSLPSTGAHRLIQMVQTPDLDWKDARQWPKLPRSEHGMLAHHTCLVRHCCNPNHVAPVTRQTHDAIHKRMNDLKSKQILQAVSGAWAINDN
jgi:hypothetical protein